MDLTKASKILLEGSRVIGLKKGDIEKLVAANEKSSFTVNPEPERAPEPAPAPVPPVMPTPAPLEEKVPTDNIFDIPTEQVAPVPPTPVPNIPSPQMPGAPAPVPNMFEAPKPSIAPEPPVAPVYPTPEVAPMQTPVGPLVNPEFQNVSNIPSTPNVPSPQMPEAPVSPVGFYNNIEGSQMASEPEQNSGVLAVLLENALNEAKSMEAEYKDAIEKANNLTNEIERLKSNEITLNEKIAVLESQLQTAHQTIENARANGNIPQQAQPAPIPNQMPQGVPNSATPYPGPSLTLTPNGMNQPQPVPQTPYMVNPNENYGQTA